MNETFNERYTRINEAIYFMKSNELNGEGRVRYWSKVNDAIRLFDIDKLTLEPAIDTQHSENRNQSAQQQSYQLPPIPPQRNQRNYQNSQYRQQQQHQKPWFNKKFFKRN